MMSRIRHEKPNDLISLREIHERGFGHREEAGLVDWLRKSCPEQLSLVAVDENQLTGHILFTPAEIEYVDGSILSGMGFAPLAVRHEFQKQGVGSASFKLVYLSYCA